MTGVGGAGGKVWLPTGATKGLRDFVDGNSSSVEIDTTDVPWLPRPMEAPVMTGPSVSIRAGSTPTTVRIEVAWIRAGPAKFVFHVLIVDGRLKISSNELAPSAARRLSDWVAAFNRELSASGRQLDSLRAQGPVLVVTTRSPSPRSLASSSSPLPVALAGLLALRQPTGPTTPWRHRTRTAKLLSVTAIFLLVCGSAAVVAATVLDDLLDDDEPTSEPEPSTSVATTTASTVPTTTQPPGPCAEDPDEGVAACGPLITPPIPASTTPTTSITSTTLPTSTTTSTTTSTSTTSSPSTTTLPPGPCANDPDADVATCGPPPVPPPPDSPAGDSPNGDSPSGDSGDGGIQCEGSDIPVDSNNDGIDDTCIDIYTQVIPPTGAGPVPVPGEVARPPRPIPATGSDSNVPLQLGVLLILAGLLALVAAHRRASPIGASALRETHSDSSEEEP